MFYAETKEKPIILGALKLSQIANSFYLAKGCFRIVSKDLQVWDLCMPDGTCSEAWKAIIDISTKTDSTTCPPERGEETTVVAPMIIQALAAPDCKTDFNYAFHGANWVCNCNQGLEQSPIDLPDESMLELVK